MPPPEHLAHVSAPLAASMPAPVAMYRAGGFNVAEQPIGVPALYICGADDGCALPHLADGQEALFHRQLPGADLEAHRTLPPPRHPQRTADAVLGHITALTSRS